MFSGVRRKGRELSLQVLYQSEITGDSSPQGLEEALQRLEGSEAAKAFARRLIFGVVENREKIDRLIEQCSENWRLDRMAKVDLAILRIATYELLFCPDIPFNVSIDEAIEVGKRYGSEDTPPFVNGVLDRVAATAGLK